MDIHNKSEAAGLPEKHIKLNTLTGGRRFAIGDIHGCSKTLSALLSKIEIKKEDYLFFLGDYIDRGPDSVGVLDILIDMKQQGFRVFPIRGNHEQMLLDRTPGELSSKKTRPRLKKHEQMLLDRTHGEPDLPRQHKSDKLEGILAPPGGEIKAKYHDFLFQLPYCYELEDFYLAHAGFNPAHPAPLEDYETMLWYRGKQEAETLTAKKKIIHGHTTTPIDEITKSLSGSRVICIDGGACFKNSLSKGLGRLVCLDLDAMSLHVQENID